jgi:uncharacterized secreted protein with C-terminal beta-propeller domain
MRESLAAVTVGRHTRGIAVTLAGVGAIAAMAGFFAPAVAPAAHAALGGRATAPRHATPRPQAFSSCANLVGYGRRHLSLTHGVPETPVQPLAEPGGLRAPGTAPQAAAPGTTSGSSTYSTTNNQEPGVEEPDTVKTDGSTIFAVSQNKLYAVDVSRATPRLAGSLDLGASGYGAQLLLHGDHLVVISGATATGPLRPLLPVPSGGPTPISPYYDAGQTTLSEVDASDPASMKVIRTMTIDGSFVDARQNGSTARFVISSAPRAIATPALRGSASGYVPNWHFRSRLSGRRYNGPVARCRQVAHPAQFSGLGMLTIFTIDLERGLWTASTDALMADAQIVYGSQDSLYVATERWIDPATPVAALPSSQTTQIDRFDATAPDSTTFVASGDVPGYLLNQFSLSESGGYLRVASTSRPLWWGGAVPPQSSQSYVTVLATTGSRLEPVGNLSGLGTGQRIYSVRFVGTIGYVVTFRQVDPLYTIDLSDPTAPRVAGQVELEGYSSYLHPLGNGLLLGVGQDVGANNEPSGAQLELFDVSDPGSPTLLQKMTLGLGSSSQVQYDHHAFLFWPPTNLAVLPLAVYPAAAPTPVSTAPAAGSSGSASAPAPAQFVGAIGLHIDHSGISEVARIAHPQVGGSSPQITRAVVIGNDLYTVSDEGILKSSLGTLAPGAFTAFPATTSPGSPSA